MTQPEQWEWEEDDDDINLDNGCALRLVRKHDGYPVLLPNFFKRGPRADEPAWVEVDREHARLIAAAPELLSALRDMGDMFCRHIEGRPGPDDAAQRWDAARAAIAKAEGHEPTACCVCTQPAISPVKVNQQTWCQHCCETIDRQLREGRP